MLEASKNEELISDPNFSTVDSAVILCKRHKLDKIDRNVIHLTITYIKQQTYLFIGLVPLICDSKK